MNVVCSSCGAVVAMSGGDCCPRCGDLVDLNGHVEIPDAASYSKVGKPTRRAESSRK